MIVMLSLFEVGGGIMFFSGIRQKIKTNNEHENYVQDLQEIFDANKPLDDRSATTSDINS